MIIHFNFIKPILLYRFKPLGCAFEEFMLNWLGNHFYAGNKVSWEMHRRTAYGQYHSGDNAKIIANDHRVPMFVVEWWMSIWERYDNAWGWIEETYND